MIQKVQSFIHITYIRSRQYNQPHQIRIQLAMVLRAFVSQQLVQTKQHTLVPAFEIMHVNPAIRNLIREAKIHQIDATIQAAKSEGMKTMDMSLIELYQKGVIEKSEVMRHALNLERIKQSLS